MGVSYYGTRWGWGQALFREAEGKLGNYYHGLNFAFVCAIYMMMAAPNLAMAPLWQQMKLNWFDMALLGVLGFGIWRGRRRGMSKELLPTLQWVAILLGAGLGHVFLAGWLQQKGYIRQVFGTHYNEHTAALMSAYGLIAAVILIVFITIKQKYNAKLEGSNFFGSNEYYWGIAAGLIRYVSILLVSLALLNAPFYSSAEIEADKHFKLVTFAGGGGIKGMESNTGDYIPSLYEVQDSVFKHSLVGPLIKKNLSILLINTIATSTETAHL